MRKIMHIFPSLELGGSQTRFLSLMQQEDGAAKHIPLSLDGNYDALESHYSSLERADLPPFPKGKMVEAIKIARRHLRAINPDLVLAYNWGSIEWAIAARTLWMPYCTVTDGFDQLEYDREITRRRLARRVAMHGARANIVPSLTLADKAKRSWGLKPRQLRYIPNGIDMRLADTPMDEALFKQMGVTPKQKVVVTVAALRPEKNIGRLIEAFRAVVDDHPDAKLLIVGDGVGRAPLQMLSERIGLTEHVIFMGHQNNPERIMAGSNVFSLSSDTEQMPISVVEAMTMGLPVVATNVGDIRRMVAEENRHYIKGLRANDLAVELTKLLDMPEEAERIGAINREKVRADYTQDRMVNAWKDVFSLT